MPVVLVVDDSPVDRARAGGLLKKATELTPIYAANGREALDAIREHKPDIVVTDLHMPEIDGLEATRLLRSREGTAHLPVIALSAAVLDAERAQAHAAGMNGFVAKPASEADLLRSLWPFAPTQPGWPTS